MKKILAISGSSRRDSNNRQLLQALSFFLPPDFEMEIASISEIPLYNFDEEKESGLPNSVLSLKSKIIDSDALLLSTPEYNQSIPGILKNAIDWLSRPSQDIAKVFEKKPTGVIGTSTGRFGTAFAQMALLPIFRYFNAYIYSERQLYIAHANRVFDGSGKVMEEKIQEQIKLYMEGFCSFIEENHLLFSFAEQKIDNLSS